MSACCCVLEPYVARPKPLQGRAARKLLSRSSAPGEVGTKPLEDEAGLSQQRRVVGRGNLVLRTAFGRLWRSRFPASRHVQYLCAFPFVRSSAQLWKSSVNLHVTRTHNKPQGGVCLADAVMTTVGSATSVKSKRSQKCVRWRQQRTGQLARRFGEKTPIARADKGGTHSSGTWKDCRTIASFRVLVWCKKRENSVRRNL